MNRRSFVQRFVQRFFGFFAMFSVLGTAVFSTGCAAMEDIANWVPVGVKAVQGILIVLDGLVTPAIYAIFQAVLAALSALATAAAQYDAINPPPSGAIADVKAALELVVSNFMSAISGLQFNGNSILAILVEGLSELFLGTLAGFENNLPASMAKAWGPKVVGSELRVNGKPIKVTARHKYKLTRRSFIHDYNSLMDASKADATAKIPESLLQHI